MKRYWIVAPSKWDPLHHRDGEVFLVGGDGYGYSMDINNALVSMKIPSRNLALYHTRDNNHRHCYCLRVISK